MEPIEVQVVNQRRSKGYPLPIWTPDLIASFKSPYSYDSESTHLQELKQDVKSILASSSKDSLVKMLKLIDTMQRLGVAYHFENEIKEALELIYPNIDIVIDLYTVALQFRILRNYGFSINSDVFNKFIDKNGKFIDNLSEDVEGLISLYEASYLGMEGEDILEEAKNFSTKHLKWLVEKVESNIADQIRESLAVPLHWRMPRAEVRGFIDIYEKDDTKSTVLLELAKLDFNLIQSVYLKELQDLAKWWKELNFKEKLPFARDRLTENYFYAMGSVPDPQFSRCRVNVAKYATLSTILDDIYDVYGLLDELQMLTDVLDRWDVKAMKEELPEYMRVWCSAMLDHVDETVQDGFNDLGLDIRPYIQAQWMSLTKAYLVEARWFYDKQMPSFDEYCQNGWVSIAIPMSLAYMYFGVIKDSKVDSIMEYFRQWYDSDFVYLPCLMARLEDDLLSSKGEMEIGEVANSIQCYKIQERVTEEQAIDHIWSMIKHSWRKINKLIFQNSVPKRIIDMTLNQARCVHRLYKYVDFFGAQATDNKDFMASMFFHHIQT